MTVHCTASGDTLSRNDTSIGGTTSRTVSVWVRKTTTSDNAFFELNYNSGVWGTSMSTFAGDLYVSEFSNTTSVDYILSGFSANQWYHFAATYDGTNQRVYQNGALVATNAWNSTGAPTGTNWNFGQSNVDLSDICIYNAVLSVDEIAVLYRQRRPRRTSGLLAYYPFFAGSNRTIDYSGNARTLTSAGTPSDSDANPPAAWGIWQPNVVLPAAGVTVNLTQGANVTISRNQNATESKLLAATQLANKTRAIWSATVSKAATLTQLANATRAASSASESKAAALSGASLTRAIASATEAKAASLTQTANKTRAAGLTIFTVGSGGTVRRDQGVASRRMMQLGGRRRTR